jgi:hypothetical protein
MSNKLLRVVIVSVLAMSFAFAGSTKRKIVREELPNETQPVANAGKFLPDRDPDWTKLTTTVGTFTGLSGFYDYQSNGGSIQHIRVNPANGNIHTCYMTSADSTAELLNVNRRVRYAFSSDGGATWGHATVPATTRSGFPTIDLLQGAFAGLPVVASHPDAAQTIAMLFVDVPEGNLDFTELSAPPLLTGQSLQPIWPYVAGASDGSVVVAGSQNNTVTTGVGFQIRMHEDLISWDPAWDMWAGDIQSGGRYPVQANGTGRVGILWNTSNGTAVLGNRWRESTNNGVTWTAPSNLFPFRVAGADTFNSYVHCDFVYNGNTPLYVFTEYQVQTGEPSIVFYSTATGFRIAVPFDSTKYGPYSTTQPDQRFHNLEMNFPSIGLSGSTIVVAYQGFQPDLDARGYNYSDVWYVASSDGGNSWGDPQRITNTATTDERYPSVSKWNAPGQFNMVWSQKTGASGLYAFPGGADTVRTSQVFLRINPIVFTTGVEDQEPVPGNFSLEQNYPNPFNPATKIDYAVGRAGLVTIKVFDILGKEVATLLDANVQPGSYQVAFDGSRLASGIYLYKMTAGNFTETRRMLLVR